MRPQLPEVFLHVIGNGQGLVEFDCLFEALGFVAGFIKMIGIFEDQPPGSFEGSFSQGCCCFPIGFAPKIRKLLIAGFDDMKMAGDDAASFTFWMTAVI